MTDRCKTIHTVQIVTDTYVQTLFFPQYKEAFRFMMKEMKGLRQIAGKHRLLLQALEFSTEASKNELCEVLNISYTMGRLDAVDELLGIDEEAG